MDKESLAEGKKTYILRTKKARLFSQKDAEIIAEYIGVDAATYRSYESRRAMPQEYISRFCEIAGINERWLLSNKGHMEADYVEKLEKIAQEHVRFLQGVAFPGAGSSAQKP